MEVPKKHSELLVFSNDSCNFISKDNSLQGNFKNFRSYINNLRKKKDEEKKVLQETIDYSDLLRKKFINIAKSLIGAPYGRKYLIKHPNYSGDLFLDCCGLVRYAFNLMKDDFGFTLGRWNQAYQYDILPDEISFDEMKPGDLIFYSGVFYPDRHQKEQLHNMTHVEIFLGDGEKTIGSRDSEGTVDIYETFQFNSERYFNIQYHFKSIDTWLRGIHKSFCPEHRWHEEGYNLMEYNKLNKYSAFFDDGEDEDDDII